ncbi:hypothetical protein HDE_01840 [Halotydeus destructor]|nr:hypothetical protein HDE_01840 [Halotydeus destructor]
MIRLTFILILYHLAEANDVPALMSCDFKGAYCKYRTTTPDAWSFSDDTDLGSYLKLGGNKGSIMSPKVSNWAPFCIKFDYILTSGSFMVIAKFGRTSRIIYTTSTTGDSFVQHGVGYLGMKETEFEFIFRTENAAAINGLRKINVRYGISCYK